jgi:hypothetical protein
VSAKHRFGHLFLSSLAIVARSQTMPVTLAQASTIGRLPSRHMRRLCRASPHRGCRSSLQRHISEPIPPARNVGQAIDSLRLPSVPSHRCQRHVKSISGRLANEPRHRPYRPSPARTRAFSNALSRFSFLFVYTLNFFTGRPGVWPDKKSRRGHRMRSGCLPLTGWLCIHVRHGGMAFRDTS